MKKVYIDISLGRTGTTSRYLAAKRMGMRGQHFYSPWLRPQPGLYYSDSPAPGRYKEYLAFFRTSVKFMYVVRSLEDWLRSWDYHYRYQADTLPPALTPIIDCNRVAVYGQLEYDRNTWAAFWKRHQDEVQRYIPADQLCYHDESWFNLDCAQKWGTMEDFLEVKRPPTCEFPFVNKAKKAYLKQLEGGGYVKVGKLIEDT